MHWKKVKKNNEAIDVYEECIKTRYPATHAYDRLLVLYRKRKDYVNELKVVRIAIEVFSEENERRANQAIEGYPKFKEDIQTALETNQSLINDNGFYCFNPYDIFRYIERLDKIKKIIGRTCESK